MSGLLSWKLFVDFCRLFSVLSFLICSLTFTWYSFISLIFLLGSLYLLDRDRYDVKESTDILKNPYKGQHRVKSEDLLPSEVKAKYISKVLDCVLYDVENCEALRNFDTIKTNTHCSFAKLSKLWGAKDYNPNLTLEANVERSMPALIKLVIIGDSLHLDGFIFELPEEFCGDVQKFGEGVRRVLKCLSDRDPNGYHCMDRSSIGGLGWCFELCGIPIFVTTFSPCYPANHSRFSFNTRTGFILLQPMYSFAIHDIGADTPITNWDNPTTIRDKIRVAYRDNGRPYYIRDTLRYPMSHDIVKPMVEGQGNVLEWWKNPANTQQLSTDSSGEISGQSEDAIDQEVRRRKLAAEEVGKSDVKEQ